MTASWERILEVSGSPTHFLEFHAPGDRRIGQNAGRFLCGALKAGGIAVAVAEPGSATGIFLQLARMGYDPPAAVQSGALVVHDSAQLLSRFVHGRTIDEEQFARTVGAVMRNACERANGAPVRAFGDMVAVLWKREERDLAVELERLWNGLQSELGFALFCSYPVDVFGTQFCVEDLRGVFDTHTHVVPGGSCADLWRVLDRAMDEVLGAQAASLRAQIPAGGAQALPPMPKAEQTILRLREHAPEAADAILERARELYETATARVYLREQHSRG